MPEEIHHGPRHEARLMAYLDGGLEAPVVADAVYLIDHCRECRSLYEQCREIGTVLKDKTDLLPWLTEGEKPQPFWRPPLRWAFAGALLLLAVGLGVYGYVGRLLRDRADALGREQARVVELAGQLDRQAGYAQALQKRLEQGGSPYANSFTYILRMSTQRSEIQAGTVRLPAASELLNLILNFEDERAHGRYRVSLSDPQGLVLWSGAELQRDAHGSVQIGIPRDFLLNHPDSVINIYGLGRGEEKLVAEGRLKIEP